MKLAAARLAGFPLFFTVAILTAGSANAVIVGGTLGTGNNNSDPAVLQSWLASNSYSSFGYWDNLVSVSDASGVYLGYNATSMTGWVLSAAHISPAGSITVAGSTYTVSQTYAVGTTDLILYEIGGLGDPALPTLPTVPLASVTATAGEFTLMTGRGSTSSTSAPYPWSGAGVMRWGTNRVQDVAIYDLDPGPSSNLATYVRTDFDAPTPPPNTTAYEAQGSVGDSGGGLFIYRGGAWVLGGIAHFVDDPDEDPTNPSEYGDLTAYSDVFTNRTLINNITGTLIPEPSSAMLLAGGALGLVIRRRR